MKSKIEKILWVLIIALSAYYLYRALRFRFLVDDKLGEKAFWFYAHLTALAPLVLGPFQFWTWLRVKHVKAHRTLGKIYLVGSLLGGVTALYLGVTIEYEGSIIPLGLLALTWLFMTTAAWITIINKNIAAHRLFVIRSYGLALVFVFLRLVGDIPQDRLFFFIQSQELRDTTLEWLSWIIPLLVIELIFSWIPQMKKRQQVILK